MDQHPCPEAGPAFVAWWTEASAEDKLRWLAQAAALVRDGHAPAHWLVWSILHLDGRPTGALDPYPGPPPPGGIRPGLTFGRDLRGQRP